MLKKINFLLQLNYKLKTDKTEINISNKKMVKPQN